MSKETPESLLANLDWNSLTEIEKSEIIIRHAIYLEITKKIVHISAVHGNDLRNLLLSLFTTFIMALWGVDPKTIILALLCGQTLFMILSKLSLTFVNFQLKKIQDSYLDFLKKKQ